MNTPPTHTDEAQKLRAEIEAAYAKMTDAQKDRFVQVAEMMAGLAKVDDIRLAAMKPDA